MTSNPFEELKRRASITRDVRFRSSSRLETRNKGSYFVIAFFLFLSSSYRWCQTYFCSHRREVRLYSRYRLLIRFSSSSRHFLEASGNFTHRAQQLHKSASKINKVCTKISLLSDEDLMNSGKISGLYKEYQEALDDCPLIHDDIDYNFTKAELIRDQCDQRWRAAIRRYWLGKWVWVIPNVVVLVGTFAILLYLVVFHSVAQIYRWPWFPCPRTDLVRPEQPLGV